MVEDFKLSCLAGAAAQILATTDVVLQYSDDVPFDLYQELQEVRATINRIRINARDKSQETCERSEYSEGEYYSPMLEELNLAVCRLRELITKTLKLAIPSHQQEIHEKLDVINELISDIYEYHW